VWTFAAPLGRADDPPAIFQGEPEGWPGGSVSDVLLGMTLSDTMVGRTRGVFGALAAPVVGGFIDSTSEDHDASIRSSLSPLPYVPNPFFVDDGYRGDDSLLAVFVGSGWLWMANDEDAFERARFIFRLDAVDTYRLEVWITDLTLAERAKLEGDWDLGGRLQDAIGTLGHLGMHGLGRDHFCAAITTKNPEGVYARLRNEFPAHFDQRLVIAYARESIARYHVLYPPGLGDWSPPRPHL
jgi:hypothetical protein